MNNDNKMTLRQKNFLVSSLLVIIAIIFRIIVPTQITGFDTLGSPSDMFPNALAYGVMLLGAIEIFRCCKGSAKGEIAGSFKAFISYITDKEVYTRLFYVFCTTMIFVLYYILLKLVGFLIASPIIFILLAWYLGWRKKGILVVTSVVFTAVVYFCFTYLLKITLP